MECICIQTRPRFIPHNVYAYFLCGLICTWIHESDAELICMRFFSDVLTYCVMLQAFICYCSFVVCVCVCVCVCVVHWHCAAQLSMFNMEKRYRNKIIIIIIIIIITLKSLREQSQDPF